MTFVKKAWIIFSGILGLSVAILLAVLLKKQDEIDALKIKNESEKYRGNEKAHKERLAGLSEKEKEIRSDSEDKKMAEKDISDEITRTVNVIDISKNRIEKIKKDIEEVNVKKNKVDSDSSDFYSGRGIR